MRAAAFRRVGGTMDPEPFLEVLLPWLRRQADRMTRAGDGA